MARDHQYGAIAGLAACLEEWLGVPREVAENPSYFDLIGVPETCADEARITAAQEAAVRAVQQYEHDYKDAERQAMASRVLHCLGFAKAILTDGERRRGYLAWLEEARKGAFRVELERLFSRSSGVRIDPLIDMGGEFRLSPEAAREVAGQFLLSYPPEEEAFCRKLDIPPPPSVEDPAFPSDFDILLLPEDLEVTEGQITAGRATQIGKLRALLDQDRFPAAEDGGRAVCQAGRRGGEAPPCRSPSPPRDPDQEQSTYLSEQAREGKAGLA